MKLGIFSSLIFCLTSLASCGRYGEPRTPETFSPTEVDGLSVTADALGINFNWVSPKLDQRGKELTELQGYIIYRKDSEGFDSLKESDATFEEVGRVLDDNIPEREKLRAEARAQGKIGRRINVPSDKMKFSFADRSLEAGKSYIYKVTAYNQDDVEGLVKQFVKVKFLGSSSQVIIDNNPESESVN